MTTSTERIIEDKDFLRCDKSDCIRADNCKHIRPVMRENDLAIDLWKNGCSKDRWIFYEPKIVL